MAPPHPNELGRILALEEGLGGRRADLLTPQAMGTYAEALFSLPLSDKPDFNYWQTFACLYLPSFLRTVFENPFEHSEIAYFRYVMYFRMMDRVLPTPAMARFVRLYQAKAATFISALLSLIASFDPELIASLEAGMRADFVRACLECLTVFVDVYSCHHTEGPNVPPFADGLSDRLRTLLPTIKANFTPVSPFQSACANLFEAVASGHQIHFVSTTKRENVPGHYTAWWSCEVLRDHEVEPLGDPSVSCAEKPSGDVGQFDHLNMCGRCECVRYCSKHHQRADWKRHKPVCTKPSW